MTWKKLGKDRKIKETEFGDVVIIPAKMKDVTPIACPVCNFLMKDSQDAKYYNLYKCCYCCGIKWAEPNKFNWLNDKWRPSKDDVRKENKIRLSTPVKIKIPT